MDPNRTVEPAPGQGTALGPAFAQAQDYLHQAKSAATRSTYARDWNHFREWCQGHGRTELPAEPETVALYFSEMAQTLKVATLEKRIAALSQAHQMAGFASPTQEILVRTVMAGIRRAKGTAQTGKRPLLTADIRSLARALPATPAGHRDRAILLLGFAGGFRRSELVGLDMADLRFTDEGLIVTLRRSKTDQEGQGREVGIPYGSTPGTCPVRAVAAWLAVRKGEGSEALFQGVNRHGQILPGRLSGQSVALILKRLAGPAGIDTRTVAGHSLRSGLATSAAQAGVPERAIMAQTGHRSLTTLRKYIRSGSLFLENAAAKVGL